jgi:hypothetical protein
MPATDSREPNHRPISRPSMLLASDSERLGSSVFKVLRDQGFDVQFAGAYSGLDAHLSRQAFDMVLLEITGVHAIEPAIQAALRVKRTNSAQFVGYLADPPLGSNGLPGDGVFPRSVSRLPPALRSFLADNAPDPADGEKP